MRLLSACFLFMLIVTPAAAEEKIDAKKLPGKWEAKTDAMAKTVFAFAADGKLTITGPAEIGGTWKLEGNKLSLTLAFGENEMKHTVVVTKLTDEELAVEDAKGEKKQAFKRVK
ncbi:MAG: glycoside hydrolase family 43 C-terminal domain-containing protein [Gemmataceae bacterium]